MFLEDLEARLAAVFCFSRDPRYKLGVCFGVMLLYFDLERPDRSELWADFL